MNSSRLVRELHLGGALSRSELVARTGLNRSTVGALVADLAGVGIVTEAPPTSPAGRGRPSHVVRLATDRVWVVVAELAPEAVTVARIGPGGWISDRVRELRRRGHRPDPGDDAQLVARLASQLSGGAGDIRRGAHAPLVGAAVAVHGVVRRSDGFVHLAPNLGWRDVPFGDLLGTTLGLPAEVANEANLGVLAEQARGAAAGAANVIYVSGNTGVGAGILVNGALLSGRSGYAGEVGHMQVNPEGRPCHCGGRGCWETEIGAPALLRRAGRRSADVVRGVEIVLSAAAQGDPRAADSVKETGRWLGRGTASLVNVFNPERVLFGGGLRSLYQAAEPTVTAELRRLALGAGAADVTVLAAGLGAESVLLGAGELALSRFLADPYAAVASEGAELGLQREGGQRTPRR